MQESTFRASYYFWNLLLGRLSTFRETMLELAESDSEQQRPKGVIDTPLHAQTALALLADPGPQVVENQHPTTCPRR